MALSLRCFLYAHQISHADLQKWVSKLSFARSVIFGKCASAFIQPQYIWMFPLIPVRAFPRGLREFYDGVPAYCPHSGQGCFRYVQSFRIILLPRMRHLRTAVGKLRHFCGAERAFRPMRRSRFWPVARLWPAFSIPPVYIAGFRS